MKTLTNTEKAEIEAVTAAYAASLKTHPTKGKYEFNAKQSNFSSVVNFSSDIADFGSPSGVYASDDFATFNRKAREFSSLMEIKRLTLAASVKNSIKQYLTSRNETIKRNRERKAEQKNEKKNNNVSRPFWY